MTLNLVIEVWQKEKWFVAKSPELDFVSQGDSPDDARKNLFELIQIQFQEMKEMGTLRDFLNECGFDWNDTTISPLNQMLDIEKLSLDVL